MIKELFELKPVKYGQYSYLEGLTYFIKNRKYSYAIYGAGRDGKMVKHWIEMVYGVVPDFYIDRNSRAIEGMDIPVLSTDEFIKLKEKNIIVLIAVGDYTNDKKIKEEIKSVMEDAKVQIYCDAQNILRPFKKVWWHFIYENTDDFENLYNQLYDEVSKQTLIEYLKTYVLGQRYCGQCFPEEYKYWGIDTEEIKLFQLSKQEVVLNVGACCGDTLLQYLKCKNPYKKFIAVEADENSFGDLCKIVDCLGEADKKKIQTDNLFLGGAEGQYTIDNIYGDEELSFINMDIEGSEMSVLETARKTIIKNRPVLAICAYHKMDDLITIPQFINQIVDNYIFALRKYPSSWWEYIDGIHQINELVLYAIPKERYIFNSEI